MTQPMEQTSAILNRLRTEQPDDQFERLDESDSLGIVSMMNRAEQQTVAAVQAELETIARAVDVIVARLKSGGRLFYVGAGTSGRLGILDAAECPPTFNTPPEMVQAVIAGGTKAVFESVEDAEDRQEAAATDLQQRALNKADVVVGITASGRTPYVAGGLRYAKSVGAATISVSCNRNSVVSPLADVAIEVETGSEVLMGSTRLKSGTAQKMVLNMLSTATMVRLGKVYRNLMVDMRATNEKLVERSKRIIMFATHVGYDDASSALSAADGHVKAAILMLKRGLTKEQAVRCIEEADGFLGRALKNSTGEAKTS